MGGIQFRIGGNLRIVTGYHDRSFHPLHREILISQVFDQPASIATRFQSNPRIGILKPAIPHNHVSDAPVRSASNRHSMAVQEGAALDQEVLARKMQRIRNRAQLRAMLSSPVSIVQLVIR